MLSKDSPMPLYYQLKEEIKHKIKSGYIQPGEKLPSENEMISQYGIGRLTIREALSQLVNEGYLEKKQGMGTFCKAIQVSKESLNIDVLLDTSDTYFIPYYIRGISEVLSMNDCNFLFYDTKGGKLDVIVSILESVLLKGTSGIIIQTSNEITNPPERLKELFKEFKARGIPYMMLDNIYHGIEASYVTIDYTKGTYMAVDYLAQLGHKNICGIFYNENKESLLRKKGYLKALLDNDISIHKEWIIGIDEHQEDMLDELLVGLMEQQDKVTGIVCYNDALALRCLKVVPGLGYKVPDDISIIGFDDSTIAQRAQVAMTSIRHPKDELARHAADKLLQIISRAELWPYSYIFEPQLIVRQSTGIPGR